MEYIHARIIKQLRCIIDYYTTPQLKKKKICLIDCAFYLKISTSAIEII